MTPPLSLLLALTWLSGASAFTPGTEHDYEVTGSVNVPGHGVFSFKMAVGLSVLFQCAHVLVASGSPPAYHRPQRGGAIGAQYGGGVSSLSEWSGEGRG